MEIPSSSIYTENITRVFPIRRSHAIGPRCPKTFTIREALSRTTADTTFLKTHYEFRIIIIFLIL